MASVLVSSESFHRPAPPLDDREDDREYDLRGDSALAVGVIVLSSPMAPSLSEPLLTDRGSFVLSPENSPCGGSFCLGLRFLFLLTDGLFPLARLLRDRCFAFWRRSGVKNPGMMLEVQRRMTQLAANCGVLWKRR